MKKEQELSKLLEFDSLAEAEKITGISYKESEETSFLGLGLMMINNNKKNKILKENRDSTFSNTVEDYIKIIQSIGFEEVLKDPFKNEDGIIEHFYIFWNKQHSVMIRFDSFTFQDDGSFKNGAPPPSVNGGSMLYNWKPTIEFDRRYLSSGGFYDGIYSGYHDCREAIKHKFNNLVNNGEFIKKWINQPFLWLLHYMDTKDPNYDYEAITKERISRLPKYVIDSITA